MKQDKLRYAGFLLFLTAFVFGACKYPNHQSKEKKLGGYDSDALNSVLVSSDSLRTFPFLSDRTDAIRKALQQPRPVLLCRDSLGSDQQLAQLIALSDTLFTQNTRSEKGLPYRNEILGVYPGRESDFPEAKPANIKKVFRVEMYNYALNLTTVAQVDLSLSRVIGLNQLEGFQPEISAELKDIAIKIATHSPEVQKALGYEPGQENVLMANTKTALNRSKCERSNHLCVAPTFARDGKALWAIVDLTDYRLVGIRWTNTGTTGPAAPLTEKKLQDDKISSCYCEMEQSLTEHGWTMKYMLTSSDGLRISDVMFNNAPVLRSAKLVDWHVSYSGTDGFGYSDAIGCPYFSQAAVIAWNIPEVAELKNDKNEPIGFTLEQTFRSEGWPMPCNYNYRQRYEFYNDGSFRILCASLGRGCGNDGTYRPVFRIAMAGNENSFYSWKDTHWLPWQKEGWNEQTPQTDYSPDGSLYKMLSPSGGYDIIPGKAGDFQDGGKGDFSFLYVTKHVNGRDEGESDLVTIGPCCNTDYHQGPEKFIEPDPENVENSSLVIWYVPQLKNNDRKGSEYCWSESVLENGVYVTKVYPCFAGPRFIPLKKPS